MTNNFSIGKKKRVRMRDVADRCGLSISTVSLVLSGDERIPEDTTRRVLETVKAMEYRPSVIARSLARRVSRTIGVILPEYAFSRNQPFFYQALQGIHQQTQPAGYKLVMEAANRVFIERRYHLRLLKEQSTDGVIFLAASVGDEFLRDMETENYPFVLAGGTADGVQLPVAKGDDLLGAKMAVRHLLSLGHKVIGHVSGIPTTSLGRDRETGYRQAMLEAGLEINPAWVVRADCDMQQAEKAAAELVKSGVTAIFAGNDVMAYGVLRGLKDIGKRIPEDVAVVGMDDLDMSAWMSPSLTTVRYDISMMTNLAAKYVLQQVQNPNVKIPMGDMPPVQLIVRQSCGGKR